jgi:hypothetical protein
VRGNIRPEGLLDQSGARDRSISGNLASQANRLIAWKGHFNSAGDCTNPDGQYGKRVRAKALQAEKGKKKIIE